MIFWERFNDICAAVSSSHGIVRFFLVNLDLLAIKPPITLFGWSIFAYATTHASLILVF